MTASRARSPVSTGLSVMFGLILWLGAIGLGSPSTASASTISSACALLPQAAARLLGASVIEAPFDHNRACTYRSTKNQDVVSVILTPLRGPKLARMQHLLRNEQRTRLGGQWVYWYNTPAQYTKPGLAGTLSALKSRMLIVIAVRAPKPESTARQAMTIVLPGV